MMRIQRFLLMLLIPILFALACNNPTANVPFPEEYAYSKPLTQPLEFTPEKKLNWIVSRQGNIKPVVKKFNINALAAAPYDSNEFKPLQPAPLTVKLKHLPETAFKPCDSARQLKLKTFVLPTPVLTKTIPPKPKSGLAMALYNFDALQGYTGKVSACFFKDHYGFTWIGCDNGLYCYDGENIRKYTIATGSTDVIVGITEDKFNRIWAISFNGLAVIDLAKGTVSKTAQFSSLANNLSPVMVDHNNNIVVSNISDSGFVIINPATLTYKHITKENGLSSNLVYEVIEDGHNNYWVSSPAGIDIIYPEGKIKHLQKASGLIIQPYGPLLNDTQGNIWTAQKGVLERINIQDSSITHYGPFMREGFVFRLLQDKQGRILAATTAGLLIVDAVKQTARMISSKQGLNSDIAISLMQDGRDRLWIGTTTGIHLLAAGGDMVYPLPRRNVSATFQAPDGKIWLGWFGAGIDIIDRQKNQVFKITRKDGIGSDSIQSIQKQGNNIWITNNQGLDIIDIHKQIITHIGKNEGLANRVVYNALKSSTGDIWFAGPTGGLDVIDSGMTTIKHLGVKEGLSDSNILDIKTDAGGLIWIATGNGGVNIIDPVKQTIRYIINVNALKGQSNKILYRDPHNNMWIATRQGICIADNTSRTITTITKAQGLNSNHITSFNAYENSVLAGTDAKVNIITPPAPGADSVAKWQISNLDNSDILKKENNSWATDFITLNGEFWWCDNGVTIINKVKPANDNASTFITGLIIMSQPRMFATETLTGKDTLWDADSFYVKGDLLPVEAAARQQGLSWASVSGPYNMPQNLRIPYHQNYLQFQFTQTSPGRQDTVFYTYLLAGIDKQWSAVTTKNISENYLNLPPGTYTFKVKSKAISGYWVSSPGLTFTITPPWWKTWWFYTLSGLLCIIIIRGYIVFRSRKLKKENKLLEDKINLRTTQLQQSLDNLKATQSQLIQSEKMASLGELTAGIAHEIQNPLNFINNFSEVNNELIDELKQEWLKANEQRDKTLEDELLADIIANNEKIAFHGKRADGIVKGMLQHSRKSSGTKEPTDINALCDEYLRLSYHGLRAKDKSFNAEFKTVLDESIGKINMVPQDIGRVLLNLLNNAFYAVNDKKKTAGPDYKPMVIIQTKKTGEEDIEIKVIDNGKGIPQNVINKIFQPFFTTKPTGEGTGLGLSLTYDIITKQHNGTINVESKEGEGTTFIINLPVTVS